MRNLYALAAAGMICAATVVAMPASAATVVYGVGNPGGAVTLLPAGPGAVSNSLSFDVVGTGAFSATFTFANPFMPAVAGGSASFNFDPDIVTFSSGNFTGGGTFSVVTGPTGSSIQVDRIILGAGPQTLVINGTLTHGAGGNDFARIGGSVTLTNAAVPEPAAWALFILGFGAVGHTLRRRNAKVRVARASLNFA